MPPPTPAEIPPLREAFQQFLRLVRLIRSYWAPLLKGMALGIVVALLAMVMPFISKLLIDEVYPTGNATLLHLLVGGVLAFSVARTVMGGIRSYFTQYTTSHLTESTNLLFFNHLQHLPVRFFDNHRVGEILSRFADVRSSLSSVSRVFETVLLNGIYLVIVPPILFTLHWQLAVVALIMLPVTITITIFSARVLRRFYKRSAEAQAELNAYKMEALSHIRTLKAMAMEPKVYQSATAQTRTTLQLQLKAAGLGQIFGATNAFFRALGTALFTLFGWTLVIRGELTLGSFIAFSAYVGYLYNPLAQVTNLFADFQRSAVNLVRMFEYLDLPPEQDPSLSYEPAPPLEHVLNGDIRLREVSFGYSSDKLALRSIDLHIPPGQVTAVIGPSGAGKSSLLRLITRTEFPDSGQIEFDGRSASSFKLSELRRQIAVVWQDFGLLKGTIRENLVLGADNPPQELIDEAIRICQLDELIAELPQGCDTPVGEWGATLSAGQRQRLAIARALLMDAPIVVLDEVTANVDPETEREILRHLLPRLVDKTLIFVTHRVSTAGLADQIVVLDQGAVECVGSHEGLLENSPVYRRLLGVDERGASRARRFRITGPPG